MRKPPNWLLGAAAVAALVTAIDAKADPKGAAPHNGLVEAEAHNFDQHQILYGSVYDWGNSYVFTISNGQKFSPIRIFAHFQFLDDSGKMIGEVTQWGWCAGSGGGGANRCDVRFKAAGGVLYHAAARIKMYAERTDKGLARGDDTPIVSFTKQF